MKKQTFSEIGLLICALLWGASGVLTQVALTEMSPMALIFYRFLISGVLGVVAFRLLPSKISPLLLKHSLNLSLLMMVIYISSTYGLQYTSASNAGFIIGSAVVLVPLFNWLFYKQRLSFKDTASAMLCLLGLGLVTLKGAKPLNLGDFFCFIDAMAYALYILYNSKLPLSTDVKALSTLQYVMVSVMTALWLWQFESFPYQFTMTTLAATLILGVGCTFLAFLIQMVAQRYTTAERTGRLLTLIPIFTVLFDWLWFNVFLTPSAAIGGGIIVLTVMFGDKLLAMPLLTKEKKLDADRPIGEK